MKRTLLALGGAVLLLATACGSSGQRTSASTTPVTAGLLPGTTTTPTTDPVTSTTTTTTPPVPTTVPDTSVVPRRITVAYVDAVLAKLNHVYGDALRTLVARNKVTTAVFVDLASIYARPLESEEINLFAHGSTAGLTNIKPDPGDRRMTIVKLVHSSRTCVFLEVRINEAAVDKTSPPQPYATYEGLVASRGRISTADPNKTHWKFFADIALGGPKKVADGCVGTGTGS